MLTDINFSNEYQSNTVVSLAAASTMHYVGSVVFSAVDLLTQQSSLLIWSSAGYR